MKMNKWKQQLTAMAREDKATLRMRRRNAIRIDAEKLAAQKA